MFLILSEEEALNLALPPPVLDGSIIGTEPRTPALRARTLRYNSLGS